MSKHRFAFAEHNEQTGAQRARAAMRHSPRSIPLAGKSPSHLGPGWHSWEATPAAIVEWCRKHPEHNWGIRLGRSTSTPQYLVGLDFDFWRAREHSPDALARLIEFERQLPRTAAVLTGSGHGRHRYYRHRGDLRSTVDPDGIIGLEIKTRWSQQLVAPPSVHPDTGREYVWDVPPGRVAVLPAVIVELAGAPKIAREPKRIDHDRPLLAIPAVVYVPALTGRQLGRNSKIACPFHEDWSPSLHVYDGDRGWYCFQCGRGGSIIDLAAALWGVEPRGAGYFELLGRLRGVLRPVEAA